MVVVTSFPDVSNNALLLSKTLLNGLAKLSSWSVAAAKKPLWLTMYTLATMP